MQDKMKWQAVKGLGDLICDTHRLKIVKAVQGSFIVFDREARANVIVQSKSNFMLFDTGSRSIVCFADNVQEAKQKAVLYKQGKFFAGGVR